MSLSTASSPLLNFSSLIFSVVFSGKAGLKRAAARSKGSYPSGAAKKTIGAAGDAPSNSAIPSSQESEFQSLRQILSTPLLAGSAPLQTEAKQEAIGEGRLKGMLDRVQRVAAPKTTKTKAKAPPQNPQGKDENSSEAALKKCGVCQMKFDSKLSLTDHINHMHVVSVPLKNNPSKMEKRFSCDQCTSSYTDFRNVVLHKLRNHSEEQPFACTFCNKTFVRNYDLKVHISNRHSRESAKKEGVAKERSRDEERIIYLCSECPYKYSDGSSLRSHVALVHRFGYRCDVCKFGFVTEKAYENHNAEVHDKDDSPQSCEICKKEFPGSHSKQQHFTDAHTVLVSSETDLSWVERHYVCDICEMTSCSIDTLISHKKCHPNNAKPLVAPRQQMEYTCDDCQIVFLSQNALEEHQIRVHTQRVSCQICQEEFSEPALRREHLREKHTVFVTFEGDPKKIQKHYACDRCEKTCPHLANLVRHKLTHHTTDPTDICKICGQGYRSVSALKEHKFVAHNILSSLNEKKFPCTICSVVFTRKDSLRRHRVKHFGVNMYKCNQCGKRFRSHYGLTYHRKTHNGGWRYSCSYCTRNFDRLSEKTAHERIHTGEKPYMCDICGKSFRIRNALTIHENRHSGQQVFSCIICQKEFNTKASCNKHMQKQHKGCRIFPCLACGERFFTRGDLNDHSVIHENLLNEDQPSVDFEKFIPSQLVGDTEVQSVALDVGAGDFVIPDSASNVIIQNVLSSGLGQTVTDGSQVKIAVHSIQ